MPPHAFWLKKYRCATGPVSSTSRSDEEPPPALGQAEVLSVESAPAGVARGSKSHTRVCPSEPARIDGGIRSQKASEQTSEGVVLDGEGARDVFPKSPSWVDAMHDLHEAQSEVAAVVGEPAAQPGHREGLTRRPAHHEVDGAEREGAIHEVGGRDVAQVGDAREAVGQQLAAEGVYLGEGHRSPPER